MLIKELEAKVLHEDRPFVKLEFTDFETLHAVCTECEYTSADVVEYDEQGLQEITAWGKHHRCVVTVTVDV